MPAAIEINNLQVDTPQVDAGGFKLGPIDLRIEPGQYAVLVGPTGSGKTTLLEAIAGLRPVTAGSIRLRGEEVTRHRPADRRLGYVPQDSVLFPAMTVRDNLAFGLRARGMRRAEAALAVDDVAERLGVSPLLDRRPAKLSGGERQRVALGRALAPRPDLLLLDEPLSSLDAATRETTRELLRDLQSEHRFTVLHVSHQEEDADALADRVLTMGEGKLCIV